MNISCIITVHREGHIVGPSINSALRAIAYAREFGLVCELLVSMDDSDDDTIDIVEEKISGVGRAITANFKDLAKSRNNAITQAQGKYVALLDGDDLWSQYWIANAYFLSEVRGPNIICHPQYNLYFGRTRQYIFEHVDMESDIFSFEFAKVANYWTALSFSLRQNYLENPFKQNQIRDGFGYEDWTWNNQMITRGMIHKVVPGSLHCIRQDKNQKSLLDHTIREQAIPRVRKLYL